MSSAKELLAALEHEPIPACGEECAPCKRLTATIVELGVQAHILLRVGDGLEDSLARQPCRGVCDPNPMRVVACGPRLRCRRCQVLVDWEEAVGEILQRVVLT